jgi:diadenosine tetraphosphate (Ap4A) HIT family hydrolase
MSPEAADAYRVRVASSWSDPSVWEAQKRREACPICSRGEPLEVLADLDHAWITGGEIAPLPGYACVVSKQHVVEPFQLSGAEAAAFWSDAMLAARALDRLFMPMKMNYEIHGNTIPHLHLHLFPRFAEDPFVGRPIDPREARFTRSRDDLGRIRQALLNAVDN